MIKILLDQGLPRSAAELLRQQGWDALHVSDVGLAAASDQTILNQAEQQGRTVVTLDADFHALLAVSGASAPSVVRLRIEGLKGSDRDADQYSHQGSTNRSETDAGLMSDSPLPVAAMSAGCQRRHGAGTGSSRASGVYSDVQCQGFSPGVPLRH